MFCRGLAYRTLASPDADGPCRTLADLTCHGPKMDRHMAAREIAWRLFSYRRYLCLEV